MKVIVCGAGRVGFNIAQHLSHQHNDVTVIDRSSDLMRRIGDQLDVQAIEGYASDPDILEKANAENADMIVAVTQSDEVNMVACQVAHSLFNVPRKIARIRNQSYLRPTWQDLFSRDNMPIDVIISPEVEVANAIVRRLSVPGSFETLPFADGAIRVIGIRLAEACPVVDTPLQQLAELFPELKITIMCIFRGTTMWIPGSTDQMQVGDSIYFAVAEEQLARAMTVFGHEEKEARRIVIVGGGNIGSFLADALIEHNPGLNLKLIEHNRERAENIASKSGKYVVINGDSLDSEILKEANASAAETLIAVANDDEVNILSSLLAKRLGTKRAITLVNNPIYTPLMSSLGIDVYIDPRETTVSTILQHIRRGRIRGLHSIREGEAEIIEAEILETSPLAGVRIKEAKFPAGAILGAISRGDDVLLPRGETVLEAGDRVVMLVMADDVKKVESRFTVRLEYF